jgi:CRP-like cAMP-binding protein
MKEVEGLIQTLQRELQPPIRLVVIDTLARGMAGADENHSKDMGLAIQAVDRIREETDATVLLLHHPTKASNKQMRGSSALEGAADTVLQLAKKKNHLLELSCKKQKDAEGFRPKKLRLVAVGESCVVQFVGEEQEPDGPELKVAHQDILLLLEEHPDGLRAADLMERTGRSRNTVYRQLGNLRESGLAISENGTWSATSTSISCSRGGESPSPTSPTPLRGGTMGQPETGSGEDPRPETLQEGDREVEDVA